MDDRYYMEEAFKEAKKAYKINEIPVGAVIVNNKSGKIVSRGYNPNKNMNNNNQMSFNPITNLPLIDYKAQQNQMKKDQQINNEFNKQKLQMVQLNDKDRFQQIKEMQKEQAPVEYNPYKQPYSVYQGRP